MIQLFDSWVGVLSPDDYARAVLPHTRRIFAALAGSGVPRIHFGTGNPALLPLMASVECEVVSVDWRLGLDESWSRIGPRAIQGNLDPAVCLAPFEVVAPRAREVLAAAGGRAGHIFNLGHGVLPGTEADTLARLVELVHADRQAAAA